MLKKRFKKMNGRIFMRDPQSISLPPDLPGGPTGITMEGRSYIEIDGCRGLCAYSTACIAVRVKEGVLSIYGEDLCLKIYRSARIAICGRISGVSFGEDGIGK